MILLVKIFAGNVQWLGDTKDFSTTLSHYSGHLDLLVGMSSIIERNLKLINISFSISVFFLSLYTDHPKTVAIIGQAR